MNITIIGSGYVGLVSGACFSEFGFSVTCVDKDENKIARLQHGEIPIYEPGLDDLVKRNLEAKRLSFSTTFDESVSEADAIFIAVGTPTRRGDGHADLSYVYAATKEVMQHVKGYTVLITKSTVPVGTGCEVLKIAKNANPEADIDIVSNPEFLREGSAINDFMRPDRVVVGTESARARDVMAQLYRPLYLRETPILFTSLKSAELIKYAANAFLATKISYINQMADLCETLGANIHDVAKGMGLDGRIGAKFLHPGPGYGGSCFPKDTLALVKTAEDYGVEISIVDEVVRYNDSRKKSMMFRVAEAAGGKLKGKQIAVLGLSFKPETDDMRDSPSLDLVPSLLGAGAFVRVYDPAAMDEARTFFGNNITYKEDLFSCLKDADMAVVMTEWNEFRALTPETIQDLMRGSIIVDLRNIFDAESMLEAGLDYHNIGRAGRR